MSRSTTAEVAALQTALAAEHAAIYGYGVAGAHLAGNDRDRAAVAYDECRRRRDILIDLITAAGAEPDAAAPAYRLPVTVDSAARARILAAYLEDGLAAAYAQLVESATSPGLRRVAAQALTDATVRGVRWGGILTAFPGLSSGEGHLLTRPDPS